MSKKDKELRKVPTKNYIILLLLFVATFALVYYFYRWYVVYSDYQNDIPVIRDSLPELTEEEVIHYIQENQTTVVYMCTASDNNCRSFEKNFKKLIEKDSLKEYIVYLNLTNTNLAEFTNNFNNRYQYKEELSNYPSLVVFEDGVISDILQQESDKPLSIVDVDNFLKRNKIGDKY